MNFEVVGEYLEVLTATLTVLGGVAGGLSALFVYHGNAKLQNSDWLYKLYKKFYWDSDFKKIRKLLDYEDGFLIIKNSINGLDDHEVEELLVNYLNFFEFIATLWKLKQLPLKHIQMMFAYYLKNLNKHDFIREYIHSNNFSGLEELLMETSKAKYAKR